MKVEGISGREKGACFVVNGGFARISQNNVSVLAFDVTTFEGQSDDDIQETLRQALSLVHGGEYIRQYEEMDYVKARLIVKMAKYAGLEVG